MPTFVTTCGFWMLIRLVLCVCVCLCSRGPTELGTIAADALACDASAQFLHVPPDTQPGQMKAMNLTKPVYYMVVRCCVQGPHAIAPITVKPHTHSSSVMQEKSPGYSYQNIRLASTAVDWEWVGEVHEYVRRRDGAWNDRNDEIVGYWLEHDASGGNDGKRFVRDEQILSRVRRVCFTTDLALVLPTIAASVSVVAAVVLAAGGTGAAE